MAQDYKALFNIQNPTSNEVFEGAVMSKGKIRVKAAPKKRVLRFAAITAAVLTAFTFTAGAATNWQFSELITGIFGDNANVFENMRSNVDFEVFDNTFEGIDFTVSALYSDNESVMLVLDIISEKPMFPKEVRGFESGHVTPAFKIPDEFRNYYIESYNINENHQTIIFLFSKASEEVMIGNEYSLELGSFSKVEVYDGGLDDFDYTIIAEGCAKINITVDNVAMKNFVSIEPNITLNSGNVLEKISVNPFSVWLYFESEETLDVNMLKYIINFKMKDGSTLNITAFPSVFLTNADIFDSFDGNSSEFRITIGYENTLDVENLEAIIYEGIEIPVN